MLFAGGVSFFFVFVFCVTVTMAEGNVRVSMIPLNGSNYATWKVQAKMTLLKDVL